MIFNLIKRKSVIIIFFLLLISENISSRNFINILVGVNFNEEAYTAIYHNQIAPKISFTYINERQIDFFSLKHNVCFDFLIWNFYNRNGLLYFTDKTLTIEAPIEYSFTASVPSNFNIRFMFGLGFQHNTRFDRYSMGVYFWFSRLKIEPILFGVMGAELVFSNFNISFRHSIGYLVSTFILHNKEEFFLYTLSHDL
ncbi:MAG TPA: hypothetical protein PK771_10445, partial [Spirochaetota bacterium]|nr:hypothetical protein [Spirochaetota bacterium]